MQAYESRTSARQCLWDMLLYVCDCVCVLEKRADSCVGRDQHGKRIRLSRQIHWAEGGVWVGGGEGGGMDVAWEWWWILKATLPPGVCYKGLGSNGSHITIIWHSVIFSAGNGHATLMIIILIYIQLQCITVTLFSGSIHSTCILFQFQADNQSLNWACRTSIVHLEDWQVFTAILKQMIQRTLPFHSTDLICYCEHWPESTRSVCVSLHRTLMVVPSFPNRLLFNEMFFVILLVYMHLTTIR